MAYEESTTATAHEIERLRHENAILHGMRMPSSTAMHIHLHSRTVSYRRFSVALVTLSMDGTRPA
jgi:hypothetical protein